MKKYIVAAIFISGLLSGSLMAKEVGEIVQPVTICEKRSTAAAAMFAVFEMQSKGVSQAEIDKGLEEAGCSYLNRSPIKVIVHKKTREEKREIMFHFAEISLIKVGSQELPDNYKAMKFWVAGFEMENQGVIQLENGTYW